MFGYMHSKEMDKDMNGGSVHTMTGDINRKRLTLFNSQRSHLSYENIYVFTEKWSNQKQWMITSHAYSAHEIGKTLYPNDRVAVNRNGNALLNNWLKMNY